MKVTVYSKTTCPHCTRAKDLLKAEGIAFEEINLDQHPNQTQPLIERTNYRKVPQIFINDKFIGGNSELQLLAKSDEWEGLKNDDNRID
jgi:glutaredoxin 3